MRWLIPFLVLFVAMSATSTLILVGCAEGVPVAAAPSSVTVAQVVDELARRGDQVYAVSVEGCRVAEWAAAEMPDLEQAKARVAEIRVACDIAIVALERLRVAIATVDELMPKMEAGAATVRDLVAAALAAREAYDQASAAVLVLKQQLKENK